MPRLLPFVLLAVLLASCISTGQQSALGTWVSADGAQVFAPEDREAAPDISAETLEGETASLASLDGPVVVNFWASWCGPCAAEAPELVTAHERYADRGVHFVGVNLKDSRTNAVSFERDFGVPYPSWYDPTAEIAARFGGIGPAALPSTIILDAEHQVAVRLFGAVTASQLGLHLEQILAEVEGGDVDA